jgi:hypothetical protein
MRILGRWVRGCLYVCGVAVLGSSLLRQLPLFRLLIILCDIIWDGAGTQGKSENQGALHLPRHCSHGRRTAGTRGHENHQHLRHLAHHLPPQIYRTLAEDPPTGLKRSALPHNPPKPRQAPPPLRLHHALQEVPTLQTTRRSEAGRSRKGGGAFLRQRCLCQPPHP